MSIQSRIIIQIQTQLNHLAWMLIQFNVSRMQMLRWIVMLCYVGLLYTLENVYL